MRDDFYITMGGKRIKSSRHTSDVSYLFSPPLKSRYCAARKKEIENLRARASQVKTTRGMRWEIQKIS